MPAKKVFMVLMILVLCLLPIKESIASPITETLPDPPTPPAAETSTGVAPVKDTINSDIASLSGSYVTFDPVAGGEPCYTPTTPQTFCFRSESFTTTWEYVYNNWLKFPTDWVVSNVYMQGTPYCDYGGSWSGFDWAFETSPYEVNITHSRYQAQTDHCVATYCVDVTPTGIANEAPVSWYFDGDGYGVTPHNPCSNDGYTPAGQNACDETINPVAAVPICELIPQVLLEPEEIVTSGCHAEPQIHTMAVTNVTGAVSTFDITYDFDFPGDFYGPYEITLADNETANFDVFLDSHICAEDGEYIATLTVSDGTFSDQSTVYYEVYSELHEWQHIPTNPSALMDNVLAAYDGKVWSINGYGPTFDVTNYDPATDTWTTIPVSAPPWGGSGYPRSGCHMNNEVFFYGDAAPSYSGLWSYNMDTNVWAQETPSGTPPPYTGIWSPSWVADTETGLCYLTGGGTAPGGGNLATTYVYDVFSNSWLLELPPFTTVRDFHAAFLFTRPSDSNKLLCVAGGVDVDGGEKTSTQCYDFSIGAWNAENADLGALPVSLWGMGFTQRIIPSGEQLWMVAGAFSGIPTTVTWFYDVNTGVWIEGGALATDPAYRTAAVALDDEVFQIGGSVGTFNPSGNSNKTVDTICPACVLPGFTKQATEFAYPGQTIHYNISVDPLPPDTAFMIDYLPESIEYVPGSLSVSPDVGSYDYDPVDREIWWYYAPGSAKDSGWTPAEKSGTSTSTDITTQSRAPALITQSESPDYTIESVLWDQPLSSTNFNAYVSDEFLDYPTYSSFLADDFVATSPWLIDTFFVPGDGWNGFTTLYNATALTFMIYEDNAGLPAGDPSGGGMPPVWVYTLPLTDPQLTITTGYSGFPSNTLLVLDEPILLPAGHYWFVFYPTLEFGTGGQYGRQAADTINSNTAQFINPGGGFGYEPVWQPWTVLGPTQLDLAFRIEGTEQATLQIEFDATASEYNQLNWNNAYFEYGSYVLSASAKTFTGYGTYLPITIK